MGSILHANAKTTPRIRTEIQNATASIAVLAKYYKLNPKNNQPLEKYKIYG